MHNVVKEFSHFILSVATYKRFHDKNVHVNGIFEDFSPCLKPIFHHENKICPRNVFGSRSMTTKVVCVFSPQNDRMPQISPSVAYTASRCLLPFERCMTPHNHWDAALTKWATTMLERDTCDVTGHRRGLKIELQSTWLQKATPCCHPHSNPLPNRCNHGSSEHFCSDDAVSSFGGPIGEGSA